MEGLEELRAKMQALPTEFGRKALRRAIRKAMQPLEDDIRHRAAWIDDPKTKEKIFLNIATRNSTQYEKRTGDLMSRVGVLGGARHYAANKENRSKGRVGASYATLGDKANPGGDTFYWRFVELGTARTAARPFIRPAMDSAASSVFTTFATEAEAALDRALAKVAKGKR